MRVLIVHNYYKIRGGEDSVVESEIALLKKNNHDVLTYFRNNSDLLRYSPLKLALTTLWSIKSFKKISELIRENKPEIIHVHNTLPLVSPSIYWAANKYRIPIVQTVHNYRLSCLNALFLRDGKLCEECIGKFPYAGILNSCYRASRKASAVLAFMLLLHRTIGTYKNKISHYIALSEFSKNKLVLSGVSNKKITIKPNYIDHVLEKSTKRSNELLYVGRLSNEKGISLLLDALSKLNGYKVTVIGEGPELPLVQNNINIKYIGKLTNESVLKRMSSALALLIPSICYENFPRIIVEAYSCGLPVIASSIGSIKNLVDDGETGLLFDPISSTDMAKKIDWAVSNQEEMKKMGSKARKKYENEYTAEKNYKQLIDIYSRTISSQKTDY
ncbi:MAG: glycosyltransferase family 4 protein [Candidatus Thiodiazotropha lotti]|nr:glycosyltransferase family 4 protein [Candidatus Thiodiazotropha lotti]MCG8000620.1 glycosyltransferase family 4 protein [Candidatus Thiodiazotropha lotti]MCW4181702.1 glycosyltransferase family 4 protein [Candidatus Thiodiazotropha weberae]MCW4192391.1 glycosyltransferase family 4 protein [Candidatus Thiodiazotropha weberae]